MTSGKPTRKARTKVPLAAQIGVVALLFVAALGTLAYTGLAAVGREGRRAEIERTLRRADAALDLRGRELLAAIPPWPATPRTGWGEIDRLLAAESAEAIGPFPGVEGGYFSREGHRFLGTVGPAADGRATPRPGQGPPPKEFDLIETQADAAIRKRQASFVVEVVPPSTVAIRTAPVFDRPGGRVVGASWTMSRLVDPVFLDRSMRGYASAATLALGGIALALGLTVGLARSLRQAAAEQRRLHDELRRSERLIALGKLLAGVAHEVRNPLAGIRSITQLWRRGLARSDEAFAHLMDEVDRLEGIVSRLLQFSRADAQAMAPGHLGEVVAEAARLAGPQAAEQGVRVETVLERGLPQVEMSAPALLQVFRNLTGNSLQAMPHGGVLRLQTRLDPGGGSVEAIVADTGPGLSPEVLDHLFEPFFTTKPQGTGLGLPIAREIALAHRGELEAGPGPGGRGAAFTLRLPAAPTTPREPAR